MKTVFVVLSFLVTSVAFAAPVGWWKCGPTFNTSWYQNMGAGICREWVDVNQTCTNPFGASITVLVSSTTDCKDIVCPIAQNNFDPYNRIFDASYLDGRSEQSLYECEVRNLVQEMIDINASGVTYVNPNYLNEGLMLGNESLYKECFEFRYSLSGYDFDYDSYGLGCIPLVISLPILIPENNSPRFETNCLDISPIPASNNLIIEFNGHHSNVDALELVSINSGNVVYQKIAQIQPTENINVSPYPSGSYVLVIVNGAEAHSVTIQLE